MKIKSQIPFDVGLFRDQYLDDISNIKSPKELNIKKIPHSYANTYVFKHHYLQRRLYIARNVSYGLFASFFCVGVCMFGYPVWKEYPGLVPPLKPSECPELLRLCTMSNLPKNTESWFIGSCLRKMKYDWKKETGDSPKCVTSLCDNALGFDGALYKATNFIFYKKTKGRPANIGGNHGKWGCNTDNQKAEKTMFVYWYNKPFQGMQKDAP